MAKFDVRSRLMNRLPPDLYKRLIDTAGPGAGPRAHAIARCLKLMDSKASCDFSTSSASARKAIAVAFAHASCSVNAVCKCAGYFWNFRNPATIIFKFCFNVKLQILAPNDAWRFSLGGHIK